VHDFTARIIHEDRMAQFEREADASLLAWKARQGQSRQGLRSRIRWTIGLVLARWTDRTHAEHAEGSTHLDGAEAAAVIPGAEAG